MIEFKKERYGADVATILDEPEQIVEVMRRKDGFFDLTIHLGGPERDRWEDMTAVLRPEHFIALGLVADHTLCREPGCPQFEKSPSAACMCNPRKFGRGFAGTAAYTGGMRNPA